MTETLTMNLIVSLFLGSLGIAAFIWALRGGQFDDEEKFTSIALFDGEDELGRAIEKEKKIEEKKRNKTSKKDSSRKTKEDDLP